MSRAATDLLRVLAACAIVFNHTLWHVFIGFPDAPGSIITAVVNQAGKGAVFFFLFLSGFAFGHHPALRGKKLNIRAFYLNRALRILPLYLITSLAALYFENRLFDLPIALLDGSAMFHLYFIALIIYIYICFPLLYRIKLKSRWAFLFLALLLFFNVLGLWLEVPGAPGYIWFHYLAYGLFFFQLGLWSGSGQLNYRGLAPIHWMLVPAFFLVFLDFILRLQAGIIADHAGRLWRHSVALYAMFIIAFLARYGPDKQSSVMRILARASFLVYLVHPFIIKRTYHLGPAWQFVFTLSSSWAVAIALTLLARRNAFAGFLLGEGDRIIAPLRHPQNLEASPGKKQLLPESFPAKAPSRR